MSTHREQAKHLACTDRTGRTADFTYTVELGESTRSEREWTYRVRSVAADEQLDFFELMVVELDSDTVRVASLGNNRYAPVSAKGIFEALIPRVAQELGRRVESSPAQGTALYVFRTPAASKAWRRLVAAGIAQYDSENDIFYVGKPPSKRCELNEE